MGLSRQHGAMGGSTTGNTTSVAHLFVRVAYDMWRRRRWWRGQWRHLLLLAGALGIFHVVLFLLAFLRRGVGLSPAEHVAERGVQPNSDYAQGEAAARQRPVSLRTASSNRSLSIDVILHDAGTQSPGAPCGRVTRPHPRPRIYDHAYAPAAQMRLLVPIESVCRSVHAHIMGNHYFSKASTGLRRCPVSGLSSGRPGGRALTKLATAATRSCSGPISSVGSVSSETILDRGLREVLHR